MPNRVSLCQTQLARMGEGARAFEARLVEAGAEVEKQGCLNLCFGCQQMLVARFDGAPIGARSEDELVAQVREACAA